MKLTKKYDLFQKDGNYMVAENNVFGNQWTGKTVITPGMKQEDKENAVLDLINKYGKRKCYTKVLKEIG